MLVQLRRIVSAVAVVLVGLGLVVFDPSGPQALAYTSVPAPPITWLPKTTTPEVNTMTPGQWNTALNTNPNKVYGNPGVSGTAAGKVGGNVLGSGAGAGAVAVGGFLVGTDLGTEISSVIGLPTSGSFICDVGTMFGSKCALGQASTYEANGDIGAPTPPGWANGATLTGYKYGGTPYWLYWSDGAAVSASVTAAPAFGAVSGRLTVQVSHAGTWNPHPASPNEQPQPLIQPWAVFRTGATYAGVQMTSADCSWSGSVYVCTKVVQSTGAVFDHVELIPASGSFVGGVLLDMWTTIKGLPWYPQGHTKWVPGQDANPQRWWETTWQCSAGAPGGSQRSAGFTEADPEWPGFPTAQCTAGSVVTSILVDQITENGESQRVWEWTAGDGYTEWADTYPQCVGGGCELLLKRIDLVTGARVSCFDNPTLCAKWMADPNKGEQYECSYGGTVVALEQCFVYAPTFEMGPGSNYADPDGNVDPNPSPGGETDPDGPARDESCPPPFSWSSLFNPWWYFKGTVCALQSAFVPSPAAVQQDIARLNTGLQGHAPTNAVVAVPGVVRAIGTGWGSSCTSLPNFSTLQGKPLRLPCEPPDSAGFRLAYGLQVAVLWTVVAFAVWRMAHLAVSGRD